MTSTQDFGTRRISKQRILAGAFAVVRDKSGCRLRLRLWPSQAFSEECVPKTAVFFFSQLKHMLWVLKSLNETVLLSTQKIC